MNEPTIANEPPKFVKRLKEPRGRVIHPLEVAANSKPGRRAQKRLEKKLPKLIHAGKKQAQYCYSGKK